MRERDPGYLSCDKYPLKLCVIETVLIRTDWSLKSSTFVATLKSNGCFIICNQIYNLHSTDKVRNVHSIKSGDQYQKNYLRIVSRTGTLEIWRQDLPAIRLSLHAQHRCEPNSRALTIMKCGPRGRGRPHSAAAWVAQGTGPQTKLCNFSVFIIVISRVDTIFF